MKQIRLSGFLSEMHLHWSQADTQVGQCQFFILVIATLCIVSLKVHDEQTFFLDVAPLWSVVVLQYKMALKQLQMQQVCNLMRNGKLSTNQSSKRPKFSA